MKKKLRHIIVVNILISIILVAILEITLSYFAPIYPCDIQKAYKYDPELGYTQKENTHYSKVTDFLMEITTDDYGNAGFQTKSDNFEKLVFTVGDSYVNGTGLSTDESFPFQLNLQLNTTTGIYTPYYRVVNLGVGGYSPSQEIIRLKRAINEIGTPDYIVYMGCSNDYSDDQLFKSGYKHKHLVAGNPNYSINPELQGEISQSSQLLFRLRRIASNIRRSTQTKNMNNSLPTSELIVDSISEIKQISDNCNSTLIVTWADIDNSYMWLKQWAIESDIIFADWYESVKGLKSVTPDAPINNTHSGKHYRTWVNFLIAKNIYHSIIEKD